MFQKKIDKLIRSILNVLNISDDILIAGFNEQGKDHDETFGKVFWICRQAN